HALLALHKPAGITYLHLRGLGHADPLSHVTQPPASSWVDRGTFHPRFLSRPRSLFLRGRALPEPSENSAQRARVAGLPATLAGRGGSARSANRTFHLQLDEPVQLHGVLHGKLLGEGLHEAH